MNLSIIAAMTEPGRVIGRDGGLPWRLSADLKRFISRETSKRPLILPVILEV